MGTKSNMNVQMVRKENTLADLEHAGRLYPEQNEEYLKFIKNWSKLWGMCRLVKMKRLRKEIDKMFIGEPVTEPVSEDSNPASARGKGKFNKILLEAQKYRSRNYVTIEFGIDNLEKDSYELTLQEGFMRRKATDFELMILNADSGTYTYNATGNKLENLYSEADGFRILARQGHVVPCGANTISKKLFAQLKRRMPKQFKDKSAQKFFVSDALLDDWLTSVSDRGIQLGDDALARGVIPGPFGWGIVGLNSMPDDLDVSVMNATPGQLIAPNFGPYEFGSTSKDLLISLDGVGVNVTVTFTEGLLETSRVANAINAALLGNVNYGSDYQYVARDDRDGRLILTSPTNGALSDVTIVNAVGGSTCLDTFGWTAAGATDSGADGGTAHDFAEGTEILLTDPMNLIIGMVMETRFKSEYNMDFDRVEVVTYDHICTQIENIEAVVLGTDIRLRSYV